MYSTLEPFNIKDLGKPFKKVTEIKKVVPAIKKVAPVAKVAGGKIADAGKKVGKVGKLVGGKIVDAGKTVGKVAKLVGGGVWGFIKRIWTYLRWFVYLVLFGLFLKFGLPLLRLLGGLLKRLRDRFTPAAPAA